MALNFPSSPTDGQVFNNFVYSSTKGAWLSKPLTGPKSTYGPTPPANPNPGDEWVNSNDMTAYGWYVDTDGGQWVEKTAPISANGYYSPNAIINGAFDVWQRGTTFNSIASGAYFADRWVISFKDAGINLNVTQQTFTPGSAPVAGVEGQYYARFANTAFTTGHTYYIAQRIEDVRTFAGQTVTFSYWARVSSGTLTPARVFLNQNFGSGGSAEVDNLGNTQPTYTTSWQRFTQTVSAPSVAGKTIGSGSYLYALWQIVPNANVTLDIWGVQVEAGSVATTFRRNANSLQGELAACQRYYEKSYDQLTNPGTATIDGQMTFYGTTDGSQNIVTPVKFAVPKRTASYTLTTYNGSGTSGQADWTRNGAGSTGATNLYRRNENMFHVYTGAGIVYGAANMSFHWTCSAEL